MKQYVLHQDKFDVLMLESPSNKLSELKSASLPSLSVDTKYMKFFIKFSNSKEKNTKLDDIHVGSPCKQTNFNNLCKPFCQSDNFICSNGDFNYLIDSPSHCNCTKQ